MRHTRGTKSSLFLIEFMIVLFFFLLVTAICSRSSSGHISSVGI